MLGTVLFVAMLPAYTSGAGLVGGLAAAYAIAYGLTWGGARALAS